MDISGESADLPAKQQVTISYGEDATVEDFAVIMVAAQHLEAWRRLFAPDQESKLPTLDSLLRCLFQ